MVKRTPKIEIIQANQSRKGRNIKEMLFRNKINLIYTATFVLIMSVAFIGSSSNIEDEIQVNNVSVIESTNPVSEKTNETSGIDEVSEVNVVANLAETANLAIAPNTASLSVSVAVLQESKVQASDSGLEKPKILEVSSEKREITVYKTIQEESIQQIAEKFGIAAQTVKWANSLKEDTVEAGKELRILPVDGIVYKIKSDDKLSDIAGKYQASLERIISYNSLEDETSIKENQEIVIPGGILPENERPDYVAPVQTSYQTSYGVSSANSFASTVITSNYNAKAGNAYAWGNCTWYVYNMRPDIGSFWGNASSWAISARAAGYRVDNVPVVGSIAQWNPYASGHSGYGHVAYVEAVNSDGTITISEMNVRGLGITSRRTISASSVSNFIH
ncbi:MAG: CHAP domain-containing protein [Candidatus Nanogingivalis sp.]